MKSDKYEKKFEKLVGKVDRNGWDNINLGCYINESERKSNYILSRLVDAVDSLLFLSMQFDSGQVGSKNNYPVIKKVTDIVDDLCDELDLWKDEAENRMRVYKVNLSANIVLDEQEMKSDWEKQPSGYEGDFDGYCQQVAECLATGEPDDIEFNGTQRIA